MLSRIKIFFSFIALTLVAGFYSCDTSGSFDPADKDYFIKYYGGNGNQTGVDMIVDPDDGSIVMIAKSEFNLTKRIYFVKVDAAGNVQHEKYLGGPSDEVKDIEPLSDGNFVIVSDYTLTDDNIDVKLIKVSPEGEKIDSVVYGTPGKDISKSVTVLSGGDIIVSGTTDFTSTWAQEDPLVPDFGDFMVYKFTPALDIDPGWNFLAGFGGNLDCIVKVVEQGPVYYGFGYTNEDVIGSEDEKLSFYYLKILPDGGTGENNTPDGPVNNDNTELMSAARSSSASPGYIATGKSVNGSGTNELFVCKLKESLTFEDNNDVEIFGKISPEDANQLTGISISSSDTAPQGYLIVGNDKQQSSTIENEKNNIWISKIDFSGKVKWSAKFGSENGNDTAGMVTELPDGKILILGTIELGDQQKKLSLIKLNSNGQLRK